MYFSFSLFPFRLHFRAIDSLYFPEGKSANIIRGTFGRIFRQLVCLPDCPEPRRCPHQETCPYIRIFEPTLTNGPSGLADPPRPFVFRAVHLDGRRLERGERFFFDLNIFDLRDPAIAYFVASFMQLAREGLGPGRGRAMLEMVDRVQPEPEKLIFDGRSGRLHEPIEPFVLDFKPTGDPVERIRIDFLTPTELKSASQLASKPEFGTLFGRVRDRLSALRSIYGEGPLPIDFRAIGDRANAVRMTHCELRQVSAERKSGRTGQVHSIGGFVGAAEYEGDLAEFVPFLKAAEWTGIGRQTVWGKGVIRVHSRNSV